MIGYLIMTLVASFILRYIEKRMDGSSNYELVQKDALTQTAGTYNYPSSVEENAAGKKEMSR